MKAKLLNLLALLFLFSFSTFAQNTSLKGVINKYTTVNFIDNSGSHTRLIVSDPELFLANEKVIIIEMNGVSLDLSNTPSFGEVTDYNSCGNYEVIPVLSVSNDTITLNGVLSRLYNIGNDVQLVSFPSYNNVSVDSTLSGMAWNGEQGGIIAINVLDTLYLNADIDASGLGFEGGESGLILYDWTSVFCSLTSFFSLPTGAHGGYKGRGIGIPEFNHLADRGAFANGGGGGNATNAGGGGGGNGGNGGRGGDEWGFCGANSVGGIGGYALEYDLLNNKIFLGGGGGGGEANVNSGTSGTAGGGIILIQAKHLVSHNGAILANGADNFEIAFSDGAGGAGAGGTILLNIENIYSNLNCEARGGDGGDNNNAGSCVAPGGGGGGGVIWLSPKTSPSSVITSVEGGNAGVYFNASNSNCFNTSYGAIGGVNGLTLFDLELPINCDTLSVSTNTPFYQQKIQLYPNPTQHRAFLQFDEKLISARLSIFDNQGRLIKTDKLEGQSLYTINTSNWSNGLYFFKIQSNKGLEWTKKLAVIGN